MNRPLHRIPLVACASLLFITSLNCARADPSVRVSATADEAYTEQKYGGESSRLETYVVMQGHFIEGGTVDHSIDRMPFRRIMEVFAPELARRNYLPAKQAHGADLLIVVHWGTTLPRVSSLELRGKTSAVSNTSASGDVSSHDARAAQAAAAGDVAMVASLAASNPAQQQLFQDNLDYLTDQLQANQAAGNSAQLLGYTQDLRKASAGFGRSTSEETLRSDLLEERYFIVLKAYNLHEPTAPGQVRRAAWTLHLNIGSAGNNFGEAVNRMSVAAADFVGRTTGQVATVKPKLKSGNVEVGTPTIMHERR